jgi:chromosome partitioning protein
MKIIAFSNQKGGVGKTSLLVHVAFFLHERRSKTLVIDLDTQANASFTLSDFQVLSGASRCLSNYSFGDADLQRLSFVETLGLFSADAKLLDIERLEPQSVIDNFKFNMGCFEEMGYKYVLIDTAPAMGIRLAAALSVSTHVIAPVELEVYSLQGIKLMVQTIHNIKKINPALNFLGMIPSRVDTRNPRQNQHLTELMEAYSNMIIPHKISMRSSIADAIASKRPVWHDKKTAARVAAKEIRQAIEYLLEQVDGGQ